MRIERFNPATDDQRVKACHAMLVAGQPTDEPNLPPMGLGQFLGWWAHGFAGNPMQSWLAVDDDGAAGGYVLELPVRENQANAFCFLLVPPHRRRQRIGTALIRHAARQAAEDGRSLLISNTRVGGPGEAFALAVGSHATLREARRLLSLDEGLSARLAGLRARAQAHAAGYELNTWTGTTPPEFTEGLCAVMNAFGDAPLEDGVEPVTWDADRLRAADTRVLEQGTRWYSVAAVAAGGDFAALTQVTVDPGNPEWAFQEMTAVTRPHRGHRLGLLVKVAMLEMLAEVEPQLRRIVTSNAEVNVHMVAVNEALGYVVTDYVDSFELGVTAAAALPVSVKTVSVETVSVETQAP
jgi:GNAT superfamily N-acetyltransferase